MKTIITIFFLLILSLNTQAFAAAPLGESPWATSGEMQVKLLSAVDRLPADTLQFEAALQIRHSAGWHSYWRSPGESGLAPRFDWSGSENLQSADVSFPVPKRYDEMGLTTFGYEGDIMFPLAITVQDNTKDAKLALKLDTMACKDICVPVSLTLTLDIPAQNTAIAIPSRHAPVIDFARKKIPAAQNTAGLRIESTTLTKEAIVINAYSNRGFDHSDLFVEIEGYALPGTPEITLKDAAQNNMGKNQAQIRIQIPAEIQEQHAGSGVPYEGKSIILTLVNGRESIERRDLFAATPHSD